MTEFQAFHQRFAEFGGVDGLQDAIGSAEAAATRIAEYHPAFIIGLVQTAGYMREMLQLPSGPASFGASDVEISRLVAARLRRQTILHEPGRDITLLMGEGRCEHSWPLRRRCAPSVSTSPISPRR